MIQTPVVRIEQMPGVRLLYITVNGVKIGSTLNWGAAKSMVRRLRRGVRAKRGARLTWRGV